MEGTLFKWTNYLSGWQPRWFILDNGVLSYYKSQEDVNNGCKGSIKMAVCDVVVHTTDSNRLDLIIPGEQHFYLRAATPQERQQWLIALGSSKACLANGRPYHDSGEISPDIVRTKKSELRLYCDLLMQQVLSVKTAVSSKDTPDVEKLDDATSLLSATCDTFIHTLEDCMKIANATIAYEVPHQHVFDSALPPSPTKTIYKLNSRSHVRRAGSVDRSLNMNKVDKQEFKLLIRSSSADPSLSKTAYSRENFTPESSDCPVSGCEDYSERRDVSEARNTTIKEDQADVMSARFPTFFSTMKHSFMDIKLEEDGGIPLEPFIDSCRSILPIFDKLNGTAFAPVKLDFSGNIRKILQKHSTNTNCTTLQKIILYEIQTRQQHVSNSATMALLWLKRSLEFLKEFILEVVNGQTDLSQATACAYEKTLKPYHSWVVRGVFGLALKAIPSRDVFLCHLATSDNSLGPDFDRSLYMDMENYTTALDVVVKILNDFYTAHELNLGEHV